MLSGCLQRSYRSTGLASLILPGVVDWVGLGIIPCDSSSQAGHLGLARLGLALWESGYDDVLLSWIR